MVVHFLVLYSFNIKSHWLLDHLFILRLNCENNIHTVVFCKLKPIFHRFNLFSLSILFDIFTTKVFVYSSFIYIVFKVYLALCFFPIHMKITSCTFNRRLYFDWQWLSVISDADIQNILALDNCEFILFLWYWEP